MKAKNLLNIKNIIFKIFKSSSYNRPIIDKEHGYFYIRNLLWYIDGTLSETKRDELSNLILEHLPKNDGENIMRTVADTYIDEGINKGITIGEARGKLGGN